MGVGVDSDVGAAGSAAEDWAGTSFELPVNAAILSFNSLRFSSAAESSFGFSGVGASIGAAGAGAAGALVASAPFTNAPPARAAVSLHSASSSLSEDGASLS